MSQNVALGDKAEKTYPTGPLHWAHLPNVSIILFEHTNLLTLINGDSKRKRHLLVQLHQAVS